ncbi:MAG: NlpC/P60 family protein [Actinomycetes bacterium]
MRRQPMRARLAAAISGSVALAAVVTGAVWLPAHATDATTSPASTSASSSATVEPHSLTDDLGPIPKKPAELVAYRAEVRKRVALAGQQRKEADAALAEANRDASQAAKSAALAEQQAADARDRLTLWASYLYRVNGGDGLLAAIFNDKNADPLEFIRGASDANAFSDSFVADVQNAHDAALAATAASSRASEARERAINRAAAVEGARKALVDLLAWIQPPPTLTAPTATEYGKSGPQTMIDGRSCPTTAPSNTLRDGSDSLGASKLCQDAVAQAATPQAALAIQAAFQMLGAPYACGGIGRQDPFRFDCSSLVSRAYYLGAGIDTAGKDWAPSTRDMVPWDGVSLAWWASYVDPQFLRPGDIVLYDTGGAAYRHVVMYIGNGYMLHTNACGDVAHVSSFWGTGNGHSGFLVVRRVITPGGYRIPDPKPIPTGGGVKAKPEPGAGDPKVTVPTPIPKPTPSPTPSVSPTGAPTTSPSDTSTSPSDTPTGDPSSTSPSDTPTGDPSSTSPSDTASTSPSGNSSTSTTASVSANPTDSPT